MLVVDSSDLVRANDLEFVDQLLRRSLNDGAVVDDVLNGVDPTVAVSLALGRQVV